MSVVYLIDGVDIAARAFRILTGTLAVRTKQATNHLLDFPTRSKEHIEILLHEIFTQHEVVPVVEGLAYEEIPAECLVGTLQSELHVTDDALNRQLGAT